MEELRRMAKQKTPETKATTAPAAAAEAPAAGEEKLVDDDEVRARLRREGDGARDGTRLRAARAPSPAAARRRLRPAPPGRDRLAGRPQARAEAGRRPSAQRAEEGAGGPQRARQGAIRDHRQGSRREDRRLPGQDHRLHDGPWRHGHDHRVADRRGGRPDRRGVQARGDHPARGRRGGGRGHVRGRGRRPRAAPAGGDHHGSRRPRQDDAAGLDPRGVGRLDRGRWDHPAHRRLPGRRRERPQGHVPGHAGPRGVHRHARPRRQGDRRRRPGGRRRRRRDAADASRRSTTRAPPACRSWSPSTRSTGRTRSPRRCAPSSSTTACSPRSGAGRRSSSTSRRRPSRTSTSCSRCCCCSPTCSS